MRRLFELSLQHPMLAATSGEDECEKGVNAVENGAWGKSALEVM